MARMFTRPKEVKVFYRGIAYWLDLTVCRRALVDCQVLGELDSMESLANKVEVSRSTASRFFSGRPTSLAVTIAILKALHLKFEDVARVAEDEDQTGQTGGRAVDGGPRQPKPGNGLAGAAGRPEPTTAR